MKEGLTGYELSRKWFDFAFEKREAKVQHTALYLWIVELNNRLGWKREFGIPTIDTMEGLSIGNKNTYLTTLKDLKDWGFIEIVKEAKNQYQACIISLCHNINDIAQATALTTALIRQEVQHRYDIDDSTASSIAPIDKPINQETNKPINKKEEEFFEKNSDAEIVEPEPSSQKEEERKSSAKKKEEPWIELKKMERPPPFNNPDFDNVWFDWCDHGHRIKRKALTDVGWKLWFKKLSGLCGDNLEMATKVLEQSILNSWQGIFQINIQNNANLHHSSSTPQTSGNGSTSKLPFGGKYLVADPQAVSANLRARREAQEFKG